MCPTVGSGVTSSAPRRRALTALAVALLLLGTPSARGQTDNFNDGNDAGWTRYSPIPGAGAAMFSFPNGGYRILAPPPDTAMFGPARAGSVRNDGTYTQFHVSVDLVDWNNTLDQAIGVLGRVTNVGLGTTNGYALTYDTDGDDLDMSRVTGENPTGIGTANVTLDPALDYRLVFEGNGDQLRGAVYLLTDLVTPLAQVTATDATHASGATGLVVFDNAGAIGADATFDNYVAGVVPEPGGAGVLLALGACVMRRRRHA